MIIFFLKKRRPCIHEKPFSRSRHQEKGLPCDDNLQGYCFFPNSKVISYFWLYLRFWDNLCSNIYVHSLFWSKIQFWVKVSNSYSSNKEKHLLFFDNMHTLAKMYLYFTIIVYAWKLLSMYASQNIFICYYWFAKSVGSASIFRY